MTSSFELSLLLRTFIEEAPIQDQDCEPQIPSTDEWNVVPDTSARNVQDGPPKPNGPRRTGGSVVNAFDVIFF